MKNSILNTVRAIIVAATLTMTLNPDCWAREKNQTGVHLDETASVSTTGSDQNIVERGILNGDVVLIAQVPAPWCYTSYGRYPMMVALPPGAYCQVNVYFWPYVLTGVTGF